MGREPAAFAKLLLNRGADPNHVSDWGFDALGTVADHKKTDIFKAMVAAGARYEPRHLLQCGMVDQLVEVLDREPGRLEETHRLGPLRRRERHHSSTSPLRKDWRRWWACFSSVARTYKPLTIADAAPLHRALNPGHAKRSETVIRMLIDYGARIDS